MFWGVFVGCFLKKTKHNHYWLSLFHYQIAISAFSPLFTATCVHPCPQGPSIISFLPCDKVPFVTSQSRTDVLVHYKWATKYLNAFAQNSKEEGGGGIKKWCWSGIPSNEDGAQCLPLMYPETWAETEGKQEALTMCVLGRGISVLCCFCLML